MEKNTKKKPTNFAVAIYIAENYGHDVSDELMEYVSPFLQKDSE